MGKQPKAVIDTNVLISASFRKISPLPNRIYQALKSQQFILVTSLEIMKEVEDVVNRDYIIARSHTTENDRKVFIETLVDISMFTFGKTSLRNISRDLKDDKFLVCVHESRADYIVTGDKDLLVLREYGTTKIINPRAFVEILERT